MTETWPVPWQSLPAAGPLLRLSPGAGRAGPGGVRPTRTRQRSDSERPGDGSEALAGSSDSESAARASESGVSLVLLRLNDPPTRSPAGGSAAAAVAPVAAAAAWRAGQGSDNSVVNLTECIIKSSIGVSDYMPVMIRGHGHVTVAYF